MRALVLTASGRISKSKVTALVFALFNVLAVFGVLELTPEQHLAIDGLIVALWGIFMRDAADPGKEP